MNRWMVLVFVLAGCSEPLRDRRSCNVTAVTGSTFWCVDSRDDEALQLCRDWNGKLCTDRTPPDGGVYFRCGITVRTDGGTAPMTGWILTLQRNQETPEQVARIECSRSNGAFLGRE